MKVLKHKCPTGASSFWRGVHKIWHFLRMGSTRLVGNGENIKFWLDTWVNNTPLITVCPNLASRCKNIDASVNQVLRTGKKEAIGYFI